MPVPPAYYLVLDYGKAGRETVIDWENCSKADILRKLKNADYSGKLLSIESIDKDFNGWWDVSAEFAEELLAGFEYGVIPPHLEDFLREHRDISQAAE